MEILLASSFENRILKTQLWISLSRHDTVHENPLTSGKVSFGGGA